MSGNARLYGEALAADLKSRRVAIIYNVKNIIVSPRDKGVSIGYADDGLSVPNTQDFDHVIVAAGSHSAELMAQVGLSLQVEPIKGHAVNYAKPDMDLPEVPLMDLASRSALTVFKDHLRLSGTWDKADDTFLLARWQEIAPHLMASLGPITSRWTGLRPVSRAGRPYISASSIPNLWVNTGHGHLGWTLCAGSGDIMARMILDGEADKRFIYAG